MLFDFLFLVGILLVGAVVGWIIGRAKGRAQTKVVMNFVLKEKERRIGVAENQTEEISRQLKVTREECETLRKRLREGETPRGDLDTKEF